MSLRSWILAIGLMLSLAGFIHGPIGNVLGPYDYKGYISFAYSEGEDPIDNIVFTVDATVAPDLLIVNVPSPWSHTYSTGVLELTGGSLNPGDRVNVQVSLNKYHEEGSYDVEAIGTTVLGESSYSLGVLLVGQLYILRFLEAMSVYNYPILGATLCLGFIELWLRIRKKQEPIVDSVVDDLQPPIAPVDTLPEGRKWGDDFLRFFNAEDAKWELTDVDYARWKVLQDVDASAEWAAAQEAETQVQSHLKTLVSVEMNALSKDINNFSEGVQTYSGAMGTLLKESEQIGLLYNEWSRAGGVKDILWWADLATAVVGVARIAVSLGRGTARLVIRALSSSDEAADAARAGEAVTKGLASADEAIDGGTGASQVERGAVRTMELEDSYYSPDLVKFHKEVEQAIGRPFTNKDLPVVLPEYAQIKGYYLGFTDAERVIITRIAAKARLVGKGNLVTYNQKDLAWLHRMSQTPNFWSNLRKGVTYDFDFSVHSMLDDLEISWLRNLANSHEAANAARSVRASASTLPGGITPSPPSVPIPGGGVSTRPPPLSDTLPYPGTITLPHGPPAGAATIAHNSVITLPHPNTIRQGGTLPDGQVITLPHGPPPGATLPGGEAITLPPPRPLPSGTVPDAGIITLPEGQPIPGLTAAPPSGLPVNAVRPGDASLNPSGLGGFSSNPGVTLLSRLAEKADAIRTGIKGGGSISEGYQTKLDLDRLKGGKPP
ncbi:hypothetical protein ACFL0D_07000 [Thermoproteota archaeon]